MFIGFKLQVSLLLAATVSFCHQLYARKYVAHKTRNRIVRCLGSVVWFLLLNKAPWETREKLCLILRWKRNAITFEVKTFQIPSSNFWLDEKNSFGWRIILDSSCVRLYKKKIKNIKWKIKKLKQKINKNVLIYFS